MEFLKVPLPEEISREEGLGNFKRAKKLIEIWLEKVDESSLKERLEYELERIERVIKSYPYRYEKAFDLLKKKLDGLSLREFKKLVELGYVDYRIIEGEMKFERRFIPNLFWAKPDLEKRIKRPDALRKRVRSLLRKTVHRILDEKSVSAEVEIRAGVILKKKKIKGSKLRVWIPIPRVGDQIKKVEILKTEPKAQYVAPEDHPSRTVYFEVEPGCCYRFEVVYRYTTEILYKETVSKDTFVDQSVGYLDEMEPHIVFHPYIVEMTNRVTRGLEDPLSKAKAIYDFITKNVRYSYVREYSTYENIPLFVASNLKGDCGMQALLFITMCRIAGIPAKWQSGLYANPLLISPHDWAMFHIEPIGWMFADLSFGGSWKEDETMHRFYFGNLDPFRMVANSEFQWKFDPPKTFYRSDPYDNQRGELETDVENLYYDSFEPYWQMLKFEEF